MPDEFDYLIFDGDNHLYEGPDAFTRYLPAEHEDEFFWVTDDRGRRHMVEGLADPRDFDKGLQGFGSDDQRKIMRDNGYALAGLDPTT